MIHPTAIIDPKAELAEGVEVGPYSVIEKEVSIGEGTRIGPHAFIGEGTQMGKKCQIFQFASVGEAPQAVAYRRAHRLLRERETDAERRDARVHHLRRLDAA